MSTPAKPYSPQADRGAQTGASLPVASGAPGSGDVSACAPALPGRAAEQVAVEVERGRVNLAFEAINGLAGCVDQLLRELRRGAGTAQLRAMQEEVMRVRRLVAPRPEAKEGPPRDEGPASQPPLG